MRNCSSLLPGAHKRRKVQDPDCLSQDPDCTLQRLWAPAITDVIPLFSEVQETVCCNQNMTAAKLVQIYGVVWDEKQLIKFAWHIIVHCTNWCVTFTAISNECRYLLIQ